MDHPEEISAEQQELSFPGQRLANGRRRRGIYILPSLFTVGNLLCGYYAIMATLEEAEDLLRIGAYVKGTSVALDRAVELRPALLTFLQQAINENTPFADTATAVERIAAAWPF